MGFDQSKFASVGAHSANTPNLFSYKTDDTFGVIILPNYFTEKRFQLEIGDFIIIQYGDGSGLFEVDSTRAGVNAVSQELPLNAFGNSVSVEELTSIAQLKFDLGQTEELKNFISNGGSVSIANGMLEVDSGGTPGNFTASVSKRSILYRAGIGIEWKGTGLFQAPVLGVQQHVGLLGVTDQLTFGYDIDGSFGIFRLHHGECHIQTLEVTVGSGVGGDTATVTVDDVPYTVPITADRTVQEVAFEISESLAAQVSHWVFDAADDKVIAVNILATVPAAIGAFDFSATTVVAAWTETQEGAGTEKEFVAQADWNIRPGFNVNKQMLTPFRITAQYLGGGGIEYFVEDPVTNRLELVHRIEQAGSDDRPSLRSPSFRTGLAAVNFTAVESATVKSASLQAALQGKVVFDAPSKAEVNLTAAVTTAPTNILTVRNREEFAGTKSISEIVLGLVVATSDSTKATELRVIKNAVFNDPITYQYKDKASSLALVSTDKVTVDITQGEQISAQAFLNSSDPLGLDALNQSLAAGESLTLAMNITSATASDMTTSLTWFEDK